MNHRFQLIRQAASVFSIGLLLCGCGMEAQEPDSSDGLGTSEQALSSGCPVGVPAVLKPAANQALVRKLLGVGVQVYACQPSAGTFAWVFTFPEAKLVGERGFLAGIHNAGPTWEGLEGSSVVGVKVASAPNPAPTAIPYLLLTATSHTGSGSFSQFTSIQRLSTVGGLAPPAAECTAATVGTVKRVPYQADYFFYRTVRSTNNYQCG